MTAKGVFDATGLVMGDVDVGCSPPAIDGPSGRKPSGAEFGAASSAEMRRIDQAPFRDDTGLGDSGAAADEDGDNSGDGAGGDGIGSGDCSEFDSGVKIVGGEAGVGSSTAGGGAGLAEGKFVGGSAGLGADKVGGDEGLGSAGGVNGDGDGDSSVGGGDSSGALGSSSAGLSELISSTGGVGIPTADPN